MKIINEFLGDLDIKLNKSSRLCTNTLRIGMANKIDDLYRHEDASEYPSVFMHKLRISEYDNNLKTDLYWWIMDEMTRICKKRRGDILFFLISKKYVRIALHEEKIEIVTQITTCMINLLKKNYIFKNCDGQLMIFLFECRKRMDLNSC